MGNPQDMKAAEGTYAGFISLLKWSVPLIALLVAIIVILIS
ncbi:MAG: aa3-type cytochrome c oxidase subunit IV [Erythrobacter sp.]|nr:aa3-type cytochrome c oxidase subunit IV [Erythrobacter sp.]